jgi:signal transduction histidine kinase/CheY-like chemotaxis protein
MSDFAREAALLRPQSTRLACAELRGRALAVDSGHDRPPCAYDRSRPHHQAFEVLAHAKKLLFALLGADAPQPWMGGLVRLPWGRSRADGTNGRSSEPARLGMVIVALAVLYFAAGKLGLGFASVHSSASAVWPPTGIALGAFLIFGYRVWPAIFAGAFFVNLTTAGSLFTSLGIAAGNTLEGVLGAWLVHRFARGAACFERARDIFKFAALAALLATTVSATIGVSSLALGGYAAWRDFGAIWLTWWLGDTAGALIVAPLVVLWATDRRKPLPADRGGEAGMMAFAVVAVGAVVFLLPPVRNYPLAFLCLPPLVWAAFRFGPREVATAVGVLTLISIVATERGLGPFVMPSRNESLLVLQSFMGTLAMMALPIAALVLEHKRAVAEQLRSEALLRSACLQAEAANREKDEFLAMLSHELRNPLQAVRNAASTLRQPRPAHAADHAVDVIERQTSHLARLVNDLLDATRAVTGKIALMREPVALDEFLRRCVELLRDAGRLGQHTIDVQTEPVRVHADPMRLEQVFVNLLTNALKYTPPDGAIRLTLRRDGDDAVVRVEDNGIGIAADLLPRVFDLFTQGERSLDRGEGGLGIGLTLVQRLVQLHGGKVEAHSDGPGQGSAFMVRLPCGAPNAEPVAAAPPQPAALAAGHRRVLIVEDNADARDSLRMLLEMDGHEVHAAADGETGIAMALRLHPDVVLVDIGLPRVDGYAVARALRDSGAGLRLVAVTGYGRQEDRQRSVAAGFDVHLVKPLGVDELEQALRF